VPASTPLARALRAALLFRQPSLDPARLPASLFVDTAAGCDEADRVYRAAIADVLASAAAGDMLATASAFRERVREIRAAARTEIDALLVRSGNVPIDFDPLDVVSPRVGGLNHVEIIRLADLCDRARLQVGGLRADANARIAPLLTEDSRSALATAKRARITAFHGAVHAELAPLGFSLERFSQTVESLATLADGWY
jgi:hypothetical protein